MGPPQGQSQSPRAPLQPACVSTAGKPAMQMAQLCHIMSTCTFTGVQTLPMSSGARQTHLGKKRVKRRVSRHPNALLLACVPTQASTWGTGAAVCPTEAAPAHSCTLTGCPSAPACHSASPGTRGSAPRSLRREGTETSGAEGPALRKPQSSGYAPAPSISRRGSLRTSTPRPGGHPRDQEPARVRTSGPGSAGGLQAGTAPNPTLGRLHPWAGAFFPPVLGQTPRSTWGSTVLRSCLQGPHPGSGEGVPLSSPTSCSCSALSYWPESSRFGQTPPFPQEGAASPACPMSPGLWELRTGPGLVVMAPAPPPPRRSAL